MSTCDLTRWTIWLHCDEEYGGPLKGQSVNKKCGQNFGWQKTCHVHHDIMHFSIGSDGGIWLLFVCSPNFRIILSGQGTRLHEFFCAWIGVFQPSSWSQWLPKPWYECQVPMSPSLSWAKATKKCQSIVSQGAWGSLSRHVSAINTIGAHLSPRTYLGLMKKLIDTTRQKKNESRPSGKKGPQRLPLLLSVELQCCPVIPMSWEAAPAFLMFRTPLATQHSFATGGVSIFATSDHVQLWTRFDFWVHGNRRRHWLSCIPLPRYLLSFGASWVTTDDVSVSQMQICSRVRRFECKRNALAAGHSFMWRTKRGRTTKGCFLTDFDPMVNHHHQPNHHFHGISISTFSVFNLSFPSVSPGRPRKLPQGGKVFVQFSFDCPTRNVADQNMHGRRSAMDHT